MGYEMGRSFGLTQRSSINGISETEESALYAAEERVRWLEWYNRRMEAEAEGKPFDEPPPDEK